MKFWNFMIYTKTFDKLFEQDHHSHTLPTASIFIVNVFLQPSLHLFTHEDSRWAEEIPQWTYSVLKLSAYFTDLFRHNFIIHKMTESSKAGGCWPSLIVWCRKRGTAAPLSSTRCTKAEITLLAVPRICMCFINWSEAYGWLRSDCARRDVADVLVLVRWHDVQALARSGACEQGAETLPFQLPGESNQDLQLSCSPRSSIYFNKLLVSLTCSSICSNLLSRSVFKDCRYLTNRNTLSFVNLWQTTKYLFTVEVETV